MKPMFEVQNKPLETHVGLVPGFNIMGAVSEIHGWNVSSSYRKYFTIFRFKLVSKNE